MLKSIQYLINVWLLGKNKLIANSKKYGVKFNVFSRDVVGRHIFKYGEFEPKMTDFLVSALSFQNDDIMLDIGANIGWHSIVLAKHNPEVNVIGFEPDKTNFALYERNISLNKLENITPVNKAISEKNGLQTLYRYSNRNFGKHSLLPINDDAEEVVETVNLDDYLNSTNVAFDKIKFLKIDIEGYEYFALNKAPNVLKHVTLIMCEYVSHYVKKSGVSPQDFFNLFLSNGFTPYKLGENNLEALELDPDMVQDIFWRKEQK